MKRWILVAVLALAAVQAYGEAGDVDSGPRRRLIVFFEPSPSFSAVDARLIYESLIAVLKRSDPNLIILEYDSFGIPPDEPARVAATRERDADGWLAVTADGSMDDVRLHASSHDILRNVTDDTVLSPPDRPVPYRFIEQAYWFPLTERRDQWTPPPADRVSLVVRAPPGTVLFGITADPIPVGDTGVVETAIDPPAALEIRGETPGHLPIERSVYIQYDPVTVELDPVAYNRWAVDVRLAGFQFPGIRAAWFPRPATIYVRTGITTYTAGLYLVNEDPSGTTPNLLQSNPLSLATVRAGMFFRPPDRTLRPYAELGPFLRLSHDGAPATLDPVAPWGIGGAVGLEYALLPRVRLFAEYEPLAYVPHSVDDFLSVSFPAGYYSGRRVPGYLVTDTVAVDMRNTALGVRFLFD